MTNSEIVIWDVYTCFNIARNEPSNAETFPAGPLGIKPLIRKTVTRERVSVFGVHNSSITSSSIIEDFDKWGEGGQPLDRHGISLKTLFVTSFFRAQAFEEALRKDRDCSAEKGNNEKGRTHGRGHAAALSGKSSENLKFKEGGVGYKSQISTMFQKRNQ